MIAHLPLVTARPTPAPERRRVTPKPARVETPARRPIGLPRFALVGCLWGAVLACAGELGRMALDRNKHEVVPGRVYRTGQLAPDQLQAYVREHGIRTVVNLRGRPFDAWYPNEALATQLLGVSQEDVTTSANRLPAPGELVRLIEVFDRAEHPILIHCQQGADRTGMAAAIYLLTRPGVDYKAGRWQCSPRYGHVPVHTAATMDDFFGLYESWLRARNAEHTSDAFRHWVTHEYTPGRAHFELVAGTERTAAGRPSVFVVRAHNRGPEPWSFKAGTRAGVYAHYIVHNADGGIAFADRAGLWDQTVLPGGSIDLALPIPALPPGRYRLFVDLSVRNASFTQYGSEPLTHDWDARDPAARSD
jgi:hypothetical protein